MYPSGMQTQGIRMLKAGTVSNRGQITLPASTRRRLGINCGDSVILQDRGNEIVLKPSVVTEVDVYSDKQVTRWNAADRLDDRERRRIVDAVSRLQ